MAGGKPHQERPRSVLADKVTHRELVELRMRLENAIAPMRGKCVSLDYVFVRPVEEMIEDACHEGNADVDNMKNIYDAAHGGARK